jgi:hypothetical protein
MAEADPPQLGTHEQLNMKDLKEAPRVAIKTDDAVDSVSQA